MKLSKQFTDALESGNILQIKLMLKNSLILDSSGKMFDEMLNETIKKQPGFLEDHDGEVFKAEDAWNESYFNEQMVKVVGNFSKERIQLLRQMTKKLFGSNTRSVDRTDSPATEPVSNRKVMGGAIAALGVAGLGCKAFMEEVPAAISIISVAAIGVGIYMTVSKGGGK